MNKPIVNLNTVNLPVIGTDVNYSIENIFALSNAHMYLGNNLVPKYITSLIKKQINEMEWQPVGIDGIKENYSIGDAIGSYRLSFFQYELSHYLFTQIKKLLPQILYFDEFGFSDFDNHNYWKMTHVNPLFRAIKYEDGCSLTPHYDAPYKPENKDCQSLLSLIVYLTDNFNDYQTRFLKDEQSKLKFEQRNFADQFYTPTPNDIELSIDSKDGNILLFDHRLLHDSNKGKGTKIILRTDLMFEKI